MTTPSVKINKLTVSLGSNTVISDMNLDLPSGKIIGLIGPSGSGKTTLIRCIVGRQKFSNGSVMVLDQPAGSVTLRSNVSYMAQEPSIYKDLTVEQNITYFAKTFGVPKSRINDLAQRMIELVDLTDVKKHLVGNLSGGQIQRVSLAIALIGHPKLVVLDEPTVGLDPVLRVKLWDLFRRVADMGQTLLISSHVMDEAEHCDDLVLLREGQVLAHESPKALRARTKS
jgi:ABC-2 type transport system ATP-binding protein